MGHLCFDMITFEEALKLSGEVGFVSKVLHTTAEIEGVPGARQGEMLVFESGELGYATTLRKDAVEALVLSKNQVKVGERVTRMNQRLFVEVGDSVLGKTLDVLGRQIEGTVGNKTTSEMERREIDILASGIQRRKKISKPLETGVVLVDMMVPIGMGQRELVMGDRKTGKSHLLWQIMLNQAKAGNICVYAAVGKKRTEIRKAQEFFSQRGVSGSCVVVAASSQDSPGEIFLAPYTAMTIAEFFRDKGRDVVVVLDDMSTHAKFYRELSLVSRKFPGRDSYPGDIFHVHSKLLERSGNFIVKSGEASITCLPVVETVQGDITGYVQTNLMSMTDGHIYFDSDLFFKGRRPAINPFVSVTRVGHQTQTKLARDAGRMLFDLLNSYEKTQSFLKFGAELGEMSRQVLAMGDRVLGFFDQPLYSVVPANVQMVLLAMLVSGIWDGKDINKMLLAYSSEPGIKEGVDGLIKSCDSMNQLIEESRKLAEKLLVVFKSK